MEFFPFYYFIILLFHYFISYRVHYVSMDTYSEASGFRETCMTAEPGWTDGKIHFESICNLTVSENVVW